MSDTKGPLQREVAYAQRLVADLLEQNHDPATLIRAAFDIGTTREHDAVLALLRRWMQSIVERIGQGPANVDVQYQTLQRVRELVEGGEHHTLPLRKGGER